MIKKVPFGSQSTHVYSRCVPRPGTTSTVTCAAHPPAHRRAGTAKGTAPPGAAAPRAAGSHCYSRFP